MKELKKHWSAPRNMRRGIHRISLLIAMMIGLYYSSPTQWLSGYHLFKHYEQTPIFADIPAKVLGEGYSLKWLLVKDIAIYLGVGIACFAISYAVIRGSVEGSRWIISWLREGFQKEGDK